ncbi:MAG: TonB-dependent receptor [Gemmatimonadetes bacterium]|nr:TonB-dependent receptor [Gemmatimonadota bacterium]MDA1104568.1 TonB-dependent receptor [Gemmatimonadota bacterium]
MIRPLNAALIAAIFIPSLAAAQNPPDSIVQDSVRLLGGITVSVARAAFTGGGSSTVVIDLDSLGSLPAPSMSDVLRAMPLIQIRMNSRGEMQPALRGAEDRQVAILMDGVPLTLGWDHRSDMSIIPLTAARSVTLVRGLSSVLYGPNTLGGVIEVDVARANARVGPVDPISLGVSVDGTGGTNVSLTGGHLMDSRERQWVFRGGGGFEDRRGVPIAGGALSNPDLRQQFLSEDALRLNSDARRVDGFFTTRYRADDGVWGSVSASGYDVQRGVPPEAHQDAPRLWRYPEQRRLIAAVSGGTGERVTGIGSGDLEASLGFDIGSTRIEQFTSETFQTIDATEDADDRVVTARLLGEHTLGDRADLRASATYADVSHDEVLSGAPVDEYRQRLWSLGVETEWRVGASGLTTLSLGGALDGADTPESSDKPALARVGDYGVRFGASSLVADGVMLHGGVSRRSRFPSLRELYSGALGRFLENPTLRPETLLGSEVGFTATGTSGEVQIVGFHHRLSDGIVRSTVTGADGVGRFQRVNQDEVRSFGLELLVARSFGSTTATGDLTLQEVQGFDGAGGSVELEYEPTVVGKFGLDVPLPAAIRGGGEVRYLGGQQCQNPESGGLQPLGASTMVDLSLRRLFRFGRSGPLSRVDARASLRNVTDAMVFDQCGLPQPGRLFQVQFRIW